MNNFKPISDVYDFEKAYPSSDQRSLSLVRASTGARQRGDARGVGVAPPDACHALPAGHQ